MLYIILKVDLGGLGEMGFILCDNPEDKYSTNLPCSN